MARTFASGEFVNHGSAASLDTIPASVGEMTLWAWVYRTGTATGQHIITKDGIATATMEWNLVANGTGTTGALSLRVGRAATSASHTIYTSVDNVVPLNRWTLCVAVFDDAAAQRVRLYVAPRHTPPVETAYSLQQVGTGSPNTDGAANLHVGNVQRASTLPFVGPIARGGVIARALTGAQVTALHLLSLSDDPTDANVASCRPSRPVFDRRRHLGTSLRPVGPTSDTLNYVKSPAYTAYPAALAYYSPIREPEVVLIIAHRPPDGGAT